MFYLFSFEESFKVFKKPHIFEWYKGESLFSLEVESPMNPSGVPGKNIILLITYEYFP